MGYESRAPKQLLTQRQKNSQYYVLRQKQILGWKIWKCHFYWWELLITFGGNCKMQVIPVTNVQILIPLRIRYETIKKLKEAIIDFNKLMNLILYKKYVSYIFLFSLSTNFVWKIIYYLYLAWNISHIIFLRGYIYMSIYS